MSGQQQLDLVLENFEDIRAAYLKQARHVAEQLYLSGMKELTVNDVRKECPPPDSIDPRVLGAVFKRSEWKVINYKRSERAHMRVIAVFTKKGET